MYLGMSLGHSYQGLDMTDGNWDATYYTRLSPDFSIELSHLVLIDLCELGSEMPLGIDQILLEYVVRHELTLIRFNIEPIGKQVVG